VNNSTYRALTQAGFLAVAAAAIGWPAWAEELSPTLLPPKPLPVPAFSAPQNGAVIDSGPILNPSDAPQAGPMLPPSVTPAPTRVWNVAPNAPAPQTGMPLPPRPQAPIWQVRPIAQPTGQPLPSNMVMNGWRMPAQGMPTQVPMPGHDAPAAILAIPHGAITPTARPDWNWHGYDTYNALAHLSQPTPANSATADMAPYMKYAHLWRLSQNAIIKPGPDAKNTAPAPSSPPLPSQGLNTKAEPNIEWRGTGDSSNQGTAVSESNGWNTNNVTTANYSGNSLPTRPNEQVIVVEPPASTAPRTPLQVREKISEICSVKARNLIVEQLSPIRLRIAFMVREQADAESLTTQLSALRELAPYKVDFEVQIGQ
jgi:hypothetical protein